jgi:hypothetical protein
MQMMLQNLLADEQWWGLSMTPLTQLWAVSMTPPINIDTVDHKIGDFKVEYLGEYESILKSL